MKKKKYTIVSRTSEVKAAAKALESRRLQSIGTDQIKEIGRAYKATHLLQGTSRDLSGSTMFIATIFDTESGVQVISEKLDFSTIQEGISSMEKLADMLSVGDSAASRGGSSYSW